MPTAQLVYYICLLSVILFSVVYKNQDILLHTNLNYEDTEACFCPNLTELNETVMMLKRLLQLQSNVKHFKLPPDKTTWTKSKEFCERLGLLLCQYSDIFPFDDGVPFKIGIQPGNDWTPIRDEYEKWVKIGNGPTELVDLYAPPQYRPPPKKLERLVGNVFCCVDVKSEDQDAFSYGTNDKDTESEPRSVSGKCGENKMQQSPESISEPKKCPCPGVAELNQTVMDLQRRLKLELNVKHFKLPPIKATWTKSKEFCERLGLMLCQYSDIFPFDDGVPFIISILPGDHWTPIRDKYNEWAEIGDSGKRNGYKHFEHYGESPWGENNHRLELKGNVFCCVE